MTIGNLAKAINAQAVILELDGIDNVITIHDIRFPKSHPINRTNTRAGPQDTYPWNLIELVFTALLTKELVTIFDALNSLDTRSALPQQSFTLTGLSLSGFTTDDDEVTFEAFVPDLERDAPSQGDYTAIIKLRIVETTPT